MSKSEAAASGTQACPVKLGHYPACGGPPGGLGLAFGDEVPRARPDFDPITQAGGANAGPAFHDKPSSALIS